MTGSTRLYLVRHGQVAEEWRSRVYGDLEVPLSRAGEIDAARVASRFAGRSLHAVISSGLSRAEFTASAVRKIARSAADGGVLQRIDDPRLRELHRGEWAGRETEELARTLPEQWQAFERSGWILPPPGGEKLEQLAGRVLPALDGHAHNARAPVLVVAHKWVLRVAIARAQGSPLAEVAQIDVPTCGLVAFDWPSHEGGPQPRLVEADLAAPREL